MNVDPERLAKALDYAAALRAAAAALDSAKMKKLLLDDSIERVNFDVGRQYRLAVVGAPTERTPVMVPEPTDTIRAAIGKMQGVDAMATSEAAVPAEIIGTYRGRAPMPASGFPHVFRLASGVDAMLGDMDVLAWELLK